ncbi:MAG TPA: hypothetical protein ENN81_05110 [Phycisphaerales bacterium]|nr:hypothetical protein [Phycisphaerales bacterium]
MTSEKSDDIMNILREKYAAAARKAHRGAILQPGAMGDCILTLPLAAFMKESLGLGGLDLIGHMDYISILSGRSCIDGVRSIESLDLHRLFRRAGDFDLADADPLITAFCDYSWIASFMGAAGGDFEQNLIFTANCSHSAEVVTIDAGPAADGPERMSAWLIRQFVQQCGMSIEMPETGCGAGLIKATPADCRRGQQLLAELGVASAGRVAIIHPGSGGREKCWHPDNYLSVASELAQQGFEVLFVLGPAEVARFGEAQISRIAAAAACLREAPLADVLATLSGASVFVGNDSGPAHLAAGLGVPTVVLFGPTDPAVYAPAGPSVAIIRDRGPDFAHKADPGVQRQVVETALKTAS